MHTFGRYHHIQKYENMSASFIKPLFQQANSIWSLHTEKWINFRHESHPMLELNKINLQKNHQWNINFGLYISIALDKKL